MIGRTRALAWTCLIPALLAAVTSHARDEDGVDRLIEELGIEQAAEPVARRVGWRAPRKVIVRDTEFPGVEWLQSAAPGVELVITRTAAEAAVAARDADAVIGWCDPEVLAAGPRIAWVQWLFAGVERCVAVPQLRERQILLTNMQNVRSPAIAEHAIALMLALARGLDRAVRQQSAGRWDSAAVSAGSRMRTLEGRTLLVAGLGGIGTEVARRAHALGMRVIATRARGREGPPFVAYVGLPDELPKLATQADVIVNALPLTAATREVFDARLFAAMKPSAFFVNVGRGSTVSTDALADALESGRLAGAALDVTEPEPLPADHRLWKSPNLIITPHVAASSEIGMRTSWEVARENLRRYVKGERMLSVVDVARGY